MNPKEIRLLVVEDDPLLGKAIFRGLEDGFDSVTVVRSADMGVRELSTRDYDLVLSDLDCPEEDGGVRVAEAADVPVVIYTGRTGADVDGVKVLYKPIRMDVLYDELIMTYEEAMNEAL